MSVQNTCAQQFSRPGGHNDLVLNSWLVKERMTITLTNRVDTRTSMQAVYASHILIHEVHTAIFVLVEKKIELGQLAI